MIYSEENMVRLYQKLSSNAARWNSRRRLELMLYVYKRLATSRADFEAEVPSDMRPSNLSMEADEKLLTSMIALAQSRSESTYATDPNDYIGFSFFSVLALVAEFIRTGELIFLNKALDSFLGSIELADVSEARCFVQAEMKNIEAAAHRIENSPLDEMNSKAVADWASARRLGEALN